MKENNKTVGILLLLSRIIVGLLFVFSGLVKANDPLGLSYKMQEFFEVWGIHSLNDYTLMFALVMNTFEIVAGVAVLLAWRMRFFSWMLLLLIIFFTFLTGYALLSGKIKTCGCFGDCIPLTALQSFIKDLILFALILFIFTYRRAILPYLSSGTNGGIVLLTMFACIVLQWYVLKHLPIVDCLPYKTGNNILQQMKTPEGSVPDSFAINFKYKKDGQIVQFDMDHFPDDFNDTTYEYIDRTQVLVRPGTGKAAITDFNLTSLSGTDTTQSILSQNNEYVLCFLKDLKSAKVGWQNDLPVVLAACEKKRIPFYIVTAAATIVVPYFEQLKNVRLKNITFVKADATVIKTVARENPTYIIMSQANILAKYAAADWRKALSEINKR